MLQDVTTLYEILQKLVGFHRQLLEIVRSEKTDLIDVNIKSIQIRTLQKQEVINGILNCERERQQLVSEIQKKYFPVESIDPGSSGLSLGQIVEQTQGVDLGMADRLRGTWTTLKLLISRINDQNKDNKTLAEKCLEHLNEMKRNTFESVNPKSSTYDKKGKAKASNQRSFFFSKEV